MCIDKELFENQNIPDNLICPVNKGIIVDAAGISCNNFLHVFCKECLTESLRVNSKCPLCRSAKRSCDIISVPYITDFLADYVLKCPNSSLGCNWNDQYKKYIDHSKNCEYRMVQCGIAGCNSYIPLKDLKSHEENCGFRIVTCSHCSLKYKSKDIGQHSEQTNCTKCQEKILVCMLNKHSEVCPEVFVRCTSCRNEYKRKDMDNHHKNECHYRNVQCSNCNTTYRMIYNSDHVNNVKCQYCSSDFFKFTINNHLEICPEKIITCPFGACNIKYKQSEEKNHHKEYKYKHMLSLQHYNNDLASRLENMEKNISQTQNNIDNLQNDIGNICKLIRKLLRKKSIKKYDYCSDDYDSDSDCKNI